MGGVPEGIKCKIAFKHFFFREENYPRGGSAPGGANVKIGNFLGSLVFGAHFFLHF